MKIGQILMLVVYCAISVPVFNKIYNTSSMVIDEEFHLRQGKHYCVGNFSVWDNKITTFPGLYVASAIVWYPLQLCTTYHLRLISLLASVVNLFLIYEIRKIVCGTRRTNGWKTTSIHYLEALTIAFLPPLYFFAHVYYTDILSITTVLFMVYYSMRSKYDMAAIAGFCSILMRQTNIVWVGMYLAMNAILIAIEHVNTFADNYKIPTQRYSMKHILEMTSFYFKCLTKFISLINELIIKLKGFVLLFIGFIGFLVYNGSIVVGDKTAHEATIHIPQVFYFLLFTIIFAPSLVLSKLSSLKYYWQMKWIIISVGLILGLIIEYNTMAHPYLLADNRHYTFYFWNRLLGRSYLSKFIMIPIYLVGLIILRELLSNQSFGFYIMYPLCLLVSTTLQRLLEIRYFFLPFLLLRLYTSQIKGKFIVLECIWYLIINYLTLKIFFTKEIIWADYSEPQRLIW